MDPNETLRQMLDLSREIQKSENGTAYDADKLASLIIDLHWWIMQGGFLPDRWEVVQKRAREDNNV